jgi:hypothetical protein
MPPAFEVRDEDGKRCFAAQVMVRVPPRRWLMDVLVASTVFVLIGCILAYRADTRFHSETRLPMQWGLTGEVNWYAPRRLALAFMPAFAIVILGFFALTTLNFAPRAGQERLVFPALIGTGTTLVAVQLLHFWLIAKTLRENRE